jgi:MFS family permease
MKNNFLVALLGIAVGGIGFGLVTPVTVVLLEQNNTPSWITGTVTMVGYLSIVLFSGFTGRLIDRFNVKKILISGLLIWTLGSLGHVFWYNLYILFPIKIITGIGGTFIFVGTEVLINSISNETNRGRNIGLYAVVLSAGIAVGSLLIWTVKISDWIPFVIGAVIMFIVFLFETVLLEDIRFIEENVIPGKMKIKEMPVMSLLSGAIYGVFESSVIVALPIYGLRNNFNSNQVSIFLAAFVTGGIILLYIIGRISDKYSKYRLLLFISLLLGVFFVVPGVTLNLYILLIVFFIIGGFVPAFYTIGLNYTVEKVPAKYMAQANGYFVMMYGFGTLVGPILGAMLVDFDKEMGYWFFSSLICLIFYAVFRINKNGKNSQYVRIL